MSATPRGRCLCGGVGYQVADEFRYSLICHCSQCRRATGSANKPFDGIELAKLTLEADPGAVLRFGEELNRRATQVPSAAPWQMPDPSTRALPLQPSRMAPLRGGVGYAGVVQRAAAIVGSAIFLVVAPGTLAVAVPWYLTHWQVAPPLFPIARVLGAALIVAGVPVLLDSFARFALQGLGTPAPVMPPRRLVVTGFYRHVRNPMYVAVTALIAGQGLLFGSVAVLQYGAIVWAAFFLFVLAYEEPVLSEQFADEYGRYRANVRRWWPRLTPWRG